jgi:hypothetical protein
MQTNHYGFHLDTDTPTTGVFSMNGLEWIHDELFSDNAIDPDCEPFLIRAAEEAKAEGISFNEDLFNWDGYEQSKAFIGFRMVDGTADNPQYEPDPEAEYSAIASLGSYGSNILQVVASKWGIKCALCSPCYPGQGDADTPGEFLCYSVPPDVAGSDSELHSRIFKLA